MRLTHFHCVHLDSWMREFWFKQGKLPMSKALHKSRSYHGTVKQHARQQGDLFNPYA